MKIWIAIAVLSLLPGCVLLDTDNRIACSSGLRTVWEELDLAREEGFIDSDNYASALSQITAAKTDQQFENYSSCVERLGKAREYVRTIRVSL